MHMELIVIKLAIVRLGTCIELIYTYSWAKVIYIVFLAYGVPNF